MREPWGVRTNPVGNRVHVYPAAGLIMVQNWRFWRGEYARSERRLRKLQGYCQAWCDKENRKEEAGRRLAALPK